MMKVLCVSGARAVLAATPALAVADVLESST